MIEVNIPAGVDKVTTEPLYQWDYGQVLQITGDIPSACQVHFCNRECEKTIVRVASLVDVGTIQVAIPDALLECKWPINAFIYICGEDSGYTIKHIHIPVRERKQPEDYIDPIPEDVQTELETMIANINDSLEKIETYYDTTITQSELVEMINNVATKTAEEVVSTSFNTLDGWRSGTTGTTVIEKDGYYMLRLIIPDHQFNTGIIKVSSGVNVISSAMFDLQDPTALYQMEITAAGLVKAYATTTGDYAVVTSFVTQFYYTKVGE